MAVSTPAGTCPASVDHHYLGDYPDDLENFISEELQGIAHDEQNWFFARNNDPTLWKFPLDDPTGGISRGMPGPMGDLGYDHFGDIDQYGGVVFMPVEGHGPALAAFRASDLHFINFTVLRDLGAENGLDGQQSAGWVAVDPHPPDEQGIFLYMSNDEVSSSSPLFRYRLDFDSFIQTQDLEDSLIFDSRVYLFEADGSNITSPLTTMQGGVVSPWGDLYLVNSGEEDLSGRGGVRVFDGQSHLIIAQSRNGHDPFNFQFDPNYSLEYVPDPGEEPEGVDWWNNDVPQHNTPGIYGQLHVILLNNDVDSDNFWLKHYRVDYWCVTNLDTDGDGLTDGDEAYVHNTDPRDVDTDSDGLSDAVEVNTLGTSPLLQDTDKDGVPDGSEDNDNDGLTNLTEVSGSNPTNPVDEDSDDDGLLDGTEDSNHNGALDIGETDPNDQDSDDDVLTDGCEVLGTNPTDPLLKDTDGDGLDDGQEDSNHNCAWDSGETDPNNADTDADQLKDGLEVQYGTDPLDNDTDDDGIQDGDDVEWLQNAIGSMPDSSFKSPASSVKDAMTTILDDVELAVARDDIDTALRLLDNLHRHVDGCGLTADANDWILECSAQLQIRQYIDILNANLSS